MNNNASEELQSKFAGLQSFMTWESGNGCVCKHVMQTKEIVAVLHIYVALRLAIV